MVRFPKFLGLLSAAAALFGCDEGPSSTVSFTSTPDVWSFVTATAAGGPLLVEVRGVRILLTGDIEARSEMRLLQASPEAVRSQVLVVPHHGSRTSSTAPFITAVAPEFALFAVGYRNRFGHPRADVLGRYVAAGAEIVRTDRDGAASVLVDGSGIHVERERVRVQRYWRTP